jgi:PhnB protein
MYGLIGRMQVVAGQRDALAAILTDGVSGMPGCLSYIVAEDPTNPDAMWVTEVWESQAHHRASLSLPSVQQAIARGKPLIAGFGERFETTPVGGSGLQASASSPSTSQADEANARGGYKPDGYTSVSPYLTVTGAQATLDFLVQVFDAEVLQVMPRGDGSIAHAEVRLDDTVVMLTDGVEGWPAMPSHVHVYVADVDAVFARAVAAGAVVVKPPVQEGDEDKRGGFTDAGGTTWWASTRVG